MALLRQSTIWLAVSAAFCANAPAQTQIATDGTLGAVQGFNGVSSTIPASLGRQAGANLFHSFATFNVPTGGSAMFAGPGAGAPQVSNVISRVTGAQFSSIDGRLGSSIQGANLFLINPHGILFGPNASLDLTGSFFASTANYLKLADGTRFEATATPNPVLTSAPPAAFGFLGPTGPIVVQESALDARAGSGIALVGGGIEVLGAFLRTRGADLRLESVRSGETPVSTAAAPLPGTTFGNVVVEASQLVAQSGGPVGVPPAAAGRILIRGGELVIYDSAVQSVNAAATDAARLELGAAGNLYVSGSLVYANTQGTARGADVLLTGETVTIDRASDVGSWASPIPGPTGRAGDVEVSARGAVRIVTTPADPGFTHLFSTAYGSGHGGAVRVGGDTVSLETASIESFTLGSGEAGPILLRGRAIDVVNGTFMAAYSAPGSTGRASGIDIAATERVRVAGADWTGFLSDVVTDTSTSHDAGAVRIAAPEIEVANGAVVRSLSERFATGASGSITLAGAKRVALTDDALVQVAGAGPQRGGDLRIEAGDLVVSGSSNVESASHGVGRAGDVVVRVAGEAVLDNGYLQSLALASGPAGRVDVEAGALTITNFGRVDSTTSNDGAGGDVSVRAGRVTVASAGAIAANSGRLFVGGQPIVGRGPGGRVTVEASEEITLTGAFSGVSAGTLGAGDSGNVEVRTPRLIISDGAQIGANTGGAGHAGSVTLEVGDLEVRNRGGITSGNGLLSGARGTGDAGEIRIRASGSMLVTGGGMIESSTFSSGRGGQITIDAGELTVRDGGLINTGTEGTGAAGTVTVRAGAIRVAGHTSGIFATTFGPGQGGRVQVTTPRLVITDDGEIGANTGGSGHAGSVIVDVGELELRRGFIASGNRLVLGEVGTGNSGEIQVRVAGNALLADQSLIATNTFSSGNGGRITVEGREIVLTGGSGIGAATVAAGDGGAITIRGDALRMSDASRVVAGTFAIGAPGSGDGNAGSVTVDVGRLELAGGSQIVSSSGAGDGTGLAAGRGAAGDISVVGRESVRLSGEGVNGPSGLFSQTFGEGRGGRISVTTPLLALDGGAAIDTSTAGNGPAGAIDLSVGNASLRGFGTGISSGNLLFSGGERFVGAGAGGLINIAATGPLVLDDRAIISTRTASDAPAGNLSIGAASVALRGGSLITSSSAGGGNAGNVAVNAGDRLEIFEGSAIRTDAALADGGNIDIRAIDRVHLRNAEISTSVGSGQGAGGNIFIDPTFVILENSRITANAFGGPGGRIQIFATYFLNTLDSLVDASSQLGVPGTVSINSPNTNLSTQLKVLPAAFFDASALVREACSGRFVSGAPRSSLVGVGRGGLAASPERFAASTYFGDVPMAVSSASPWTGLRLVTAQRARLTAGCTG